MDSHCAQNTSSIILTESEDLHLLGNTLRTFLREGQGPGPPLFGRDGIRRA